MNADLKKAIKCPVCLIIYQDPRVLTCGHSICAACIVKLISISSKRLLLCPTCGQEHRRIITHQDVPQNHSLQTLIDIISRKYPAHCPNVLVRCACEVCFDMYLVDRMSFCPAHKQYICELCSFNEHKECIPNLLPAKQNFCEQITEHIEDTQAFKDSLTGQATPSNFSDFKIAYLERLSTIRQSVKNFDMQFSIVRTSNEIQLSEPSTGPSRETRAQNGSPVPHRAAKREKRHSVDSDKDELPRKRRKLASKHQAPLPTDLNANTKICTRNKGISKPPQNHTKALLTKELMCTLIQHGLGPPVDIIQDVGTLRLLGEALLCGNLTRHEYDRGPGSYLVLPNVLDNQYCYTESLLRQFRVKSASNFKECFLCGQPVTTVDIFEHIYQKHNGAPRLTYYVCNCHSSNDELRIFGRLCDVKKHLSLCSNARGSFDLFDEVKRRMGTHASDMRLPKNWRPAIATDNELLNVDVMDLPLFSNKAYIHTSLRTSMHIQPDDTQVVYKNGKECEQYLNHVSFAECHDVDHSAYPGLCSSACKHMRESSPIF